MTTDSKLELLAHPTRIGQFVSVGVLGATIETIVVALLTTTAGFGPLTAKAVGAELSISTMFVVNDQWTFETEGDLSLVGFVSRWARSHLVRAVGLAVGFVVLYVLTTATEISLLVAGIEFWPVVANGIGICVGMVFNYVAESLYTWRVV
jgi:putative flippase GtrA